MAELDRIKNLMGKWIGDVENFVEVEKGRPSHFLEETNFAIRLYRAHRNSYGKRMSPKIISMMDSRMCAATESLDKCLVGGFTC